jgi:spermidine/putrescine transport system substrate-binding protein
MRNLKIPLLIVLCLSFVFGILWGTQIYRKRSAGANRARSESALRVLAFHGLFEPDLLEKFESETGIQIALSEATSPEELWDRLESATGEHGYDVIALLSYQIPLATQLVRVQPIDPKKMQNLGKISPDFRRIPGDLNHEHLVPILWGLTGFAYDSKRVAKTPRSWADVFSDKKRTPVGLLSSTPDISRFLNPSAKEVEKKAVDDDDDETQDEAAAAKNLQALRRSLNHFMEGITVNADFLSAVSLEQGKEPPPVVQINAAEMAFAPFHGPEWKFVFPEEKASFWILSMALARDARNAGEAHRFLDFLIEKDSALSIIKSSRQASTNRLVEETSLDARLKPSFLRQVPINHYTPLHDFSRSREIRGLLKNH